MAKKKSPATVVESDHRKNFVKFLDSAARDHSRWEVFTDFLKMTALSISNSDCFFICTDKKTVEEREADYMQTVNKYAKKERLFFPMMLGELALELEDACRSRYADVLGELFHSLDFQDEWKAQFFTPQHISDMSGKLLISGDKVKNAIEEKGFITINEPCCGGGSMILGGLNAMREYGLNPCTQALVVAGDLDARCVHMTYIQLSLYGIPAVVVQQNALSSEKYGKPWYTPIFAFNGWKYKMQKAGIC